MPDGVDWIAALGGLGLFLLGTGVMTEGLERLAGARLARWLAGATRSAWSGAATGALSTAVVQASSVTIVSAVGFVGAGLLSFEQALGVIFGANVGTTLKGWLVALVGFKLDLGAFAALFVLAGALLRLSSRRVASGAGTALAGFGLLFLGLAGMQAGMAGLGEVVTPSDLPPDTWLGRALLVGIGVVVTLATQSSSAGVAAALTAVSTGAISFPQAAAMVIGMDLGTTFTAWLASVGRPPATRRTGYAHVVFNLMTAAGAYLVLTPYALGLEALWPGATTREPELSLVGFHTLFNTLGTLAVLPFAGPFARLMIRLVPEERDGALARLDPALLAEPLVALEALGASARELLASAMAVAARSLRAPGRVDANDEALERLNAALSAARAYAARVRTPREEAARHRAHVALIDALDHARRLARRVPSRLPAAEGPPELELRERSRRLALALRVAARALEGRGAVELRPVREAWRELQGRAQAYREEVLERLASGELEGAAALARMDEMRRLVRLARHAMRGLHHLSLAARVVRAAAPEAAESVAAPAAAP